MSTKSIVTAVLLRMDYQRQLYKAAAEGMKLPRNWMLDSAETQTMDNLLSQYKIAQSAVLGPDEVAQLRQDLADQLKVRDVQEAVQVVPDPEVQQGVTDIVQGAGPQQEQQRRQGLLQAAKKGLLGAGTGAAAGGMASGLPGAGAGLLSGGVPAALHGYRQGKEQARDEQIQGLLAERYQEPEPPKVASSLDDLLEHLFPKKEQQKPPIAPITAKPELPTFRERQGKPTIRSQYRGSDKGLLTPKPGLLSGDAAKKFKAPKMPGKFRAPAAAHKSKSLVIAGGLAALGALGLTAAQLQKYRKKQRST
jgi:hypothetical protein